MLAGETFNSGDVCPQNVSPAKLAENRREKRSGAG
ncbi:hypothetical protein Pvag_0311 [Pantoea vagans C9-1]|jgi:hypothetical protein|nr:hypothetical protein Pvag_0311 [Pantoea vagans C9-1]